MAYFCDQGLRLLRLPFRWERIQPRLGEALDDAELRRLKTTVEWVRKHHGKVILDVHNYGRYCIRRHGKKQECVIDQKMGKAVVVSRHHFADLWRRLSQVFREEPTVYAYGLMNEPHDMGTSDWRVISQAAVDAVRGEKDHKLILVAGDGWSNAHRFPEVNGARAWIKDATGQVAYEAHCYFDHNNSGKYDLDYDEELTRDAKLEEAVFSRSPLSGDCFAGNGNLPTAGPTQSGTSPGYCNTEILRHVARCALGNMTGSDPPAATGARDGAVTFRKPRRSCSS